MSKLQLHAELLYFFGYGHTVMVKYGKTSYAQTRYRKRYGIGFNKVNNLKVFCRNSVLDSEVVFSENYYEPLNLDYIFLS
jgi:hypothetical protein